MSSTNVVVGVEIKAAGTGQTIAAMTSTAKSIDGISNSSKKAQTSLSEFGRTAAQALGMSKEGAKTFAMLGTAAYEGSKGIQSITDAVKDYRSVSSVMGVQTKQNIKDLDQYKAAWQRLSESSKTYSDQIRSNARLMQQDLMNKLSKSAAAPATAGSGEIDNEASATGRFAANTLKAAAAVVTIQKALEAARGAIRLGDEFAGLEARMKLVSGSTREFTDSMQSVYNIAQETRSPLKEVAQLYYRLAVAASTTGMSQKETVRMTDLVAKSLKVSGASATETAAGLQQFSQAMQAGLLNGDEFRSVMENMPRLSKALTDSLKVSVATLREMSAQGKLTFDVISKALASQAEAIDNDFSKIPITVEGAFTQIRNAAELLVGTMSKMSGASKLLSGALHEIALGLKDVSDWFKQAFPQDNIERIASMESKLAGLVKKRQELEATLGKSFMTRPIDVSIMGPGELENINKQIAELQNRVQGLKQLETNNAGGQSQTYFGALKNDALEAVLAAKKFSEAQKDVARQVYAEANKQGFSAAFALAMAEVESSFKATATSAKDAYGVMQLMPGTAQRFGVNIKDTADNIKGGVTYMKDLQKEFKSLTLVTAAYNAGEGNVRKYGNTVPPFAETKGHVEKVTKAFDEYSKALGVVNSEMETGDQQAKRMEADFKLLSSAQQDNIAVAEAAAKKASETGKTQLDEIQNRIKLIQDEAKQQMAAAVTYEAKNKIALEAEGKVREQISLATDVMKTQLGIEENLIQRKIASLKVELDGATEFLKQAEIKRAILGLESDLAVKVEERARLEQDAALKSTEAGRLSAEMKQKEADFINKINQDLAFQTALYNQLNAARQAGASQAALELMQKQAESTQMIPSNVSSEELAAMQQKIDKTEEYKQKIKDIIDVEKAVREEGLRSLAVMSSNLEYAREVANGLKDAFGAVGEAIGGMTIAMAEYAKQQATIDVQKERAMKDSNGDPVKKAKAEEEAQSKSAKSQIKLYGDMATSAQKFFKANTTGYNVMGAAAKVFRGIEMVQSAMSMAKQLQDNAMAVQSFVTGIFAKLTAEEATVAPTVAAEEAKATAEGTTAIAAQGEIPIVGFALMAAMAALLASYGVSTGAGGGSGSAAGAGAMPTPEPGAGTVLGDKNKPSESIKNSLDRLVEVNTNDLSYSAEMVKSLKSIESSLADAATLIAKNVTPIIDQVMSKYNASGMFGSSQVKEAGLLVMGQSLEKVLKTGMLTGLMAARIEGTSGAMGVEWKTGKTLSTKYGKDLAEAFGASVKKIYDTIGEAGKTLGLSSDEMAKRIAGMNVGLGKLNLAGKSTDEVAKILANAFSGMSDKMAEKMLPEFKAFQVSGEGYFETITRVASGIDQAKGSLELLGMTAIDFRNVTNKSGDVAAEITRQTIEEQGKLGEGAKYYVSQLTGSAKDISDAYKLIKGSVDTMSQLGLNSDQWSRTLVNAAEGLQSFSDKLKLVRENSFTAGELITQDFASMKKSFNDLGVEMPTTKKGLLDYIQTLDLSKDGNKKLAGSLLNLAEGFYDVIGRVDDLKSKYKDIVDPLFDVRTKIKEVIDDFKALTAATEGNAQKDIMAQKAGWALVGVIEDVFKSLMEGVNKLQSSLSSQIATLRGPEAVAGLAGDRYNNAQGAITSYIGSLSTGRSRNVTTEIQLIQDAQSAVMDRYNAEMTLLQQAAQEQAAVIQANLQVQIDAINAETEAKVQAINDSTEAQVQAINDTLDATLTAKQKEHEIALKGLQDQLEAANKLKSAIKGIQDYAKSMLLGSNTTLSPEKRLQEAQSQYQALLAKANAGDADAMAKLSGASDTYLQAAKEYYGSGTQYTNIFDGVKQAMDQLSAMDAPDPDSIQSHIDAMKEEQTLELKNIREAAQEQIKQVQSSAKDQIKAIQDAAKDQIKSLQADVAQQIKDLSDPNKNQAMLALKQDTINKLDELQKLAELTRQEAERQAKEALDQAKELYNFSRDQTTYLEFLAKNWGFGSTVQSHATGGSAQAGLALVGEKGPELVNFERPAQVMTAEDTRSALNGDAETKQFLADIKAELKALVTTQSAANPQLVEKLSGMESRLSKMERNQRLSA